MIYTLRMGLLAGAALLVTAPVEAQSLFGDSFWGQPSRPSANRPVQRGQAAPQRRQQQSFFSFDDDDDDESQNVPQRRSPSVGSVGAAVLNGGPRPYIGASAPPVVAFSGGQAAGTVVIDTRGRALYYVLGSGRAYRYQIAVGREGFSWSGTQKVSRVQAWPDWRPPAEMRARDRRLPQLMTGGLNNPLGAKAIYLGSTLYRIHGTNNASSIGSASSSGCFRMTNSNVMHLANLVRVGTTVQVLRGLPASARRTIAAPAQSAGAGRS